MSYKPRDARDEFAAGYVPLLRANNIGENGLNHDEIVYVKRECVKDFQFLHPGDLLVCASSGSRHLVGKAAQILSDEQETFGAFCKVVRPDPQRILPDYLAQYFQSDVYRRTIANKAAGANINNIRSEHIDDLQIPLPPIPEQKRIAAILDKICEMKRNAEARLQKLDLLVKARFVEMFGDPVATVSSESKNLVQLGDVASLKAGKFISAKEISNDGEYPCYGGNGVRGWVHDFNQDGEFPLIGRQGALCGNVQLARGRFYATEHAVVVKPILRWNSVYMYYLLKALKLGRFATGAAQPGLSVSKLEELIIDVPPLALQRQFAAFVEKVEGLKATVKKELEQVDLLYRAKLQEFFG